MLEWPISPQHGGNRAEHGHSTGAPRYGSHAILAGTGTSPRRAIALTTGIPPGRHPHLPCAPLAHVPDDGAFDAPGHGRSASIRTGDEVRSDEFR
ncbi:hypothetical protein TPA0907_29470 [Micromonospora humidisoli]|nr:hypothetical protein TPA0907_29470 [Micromonospora sp. AKA109]